MAVGRETKAERIEKDRKSTSGFGGSPTVKFFIKNLRDVFHI